MIVTIIESNLKVIIKEALVIIFLSHQEDETQVGM